MGKLIIVALLLSTASVSAQQQQPDPAFLAKALVAVQQQRNEALDYRAAAEAREAILKEEIVRLKMRLEELEKKLAEAQAK